MIFVKQTIARERRHREGGGLTIIEILPWAIALGVFVVSGGILTQHYGDSNLVLIISGALAVGSWVLYWVILRIFAR